MSSAIGHPEPSPGGGPGPRPAWGPRALVVGACRGIGLVGWGGAHGDPAIVFLGLLAFNGALVSRRA